MEDDEQLIAALALNRVEHLGARTKIQLVQRASGIAEAFSLDLPVRGRGSGKARSELRKYRTHRARLALVKDDLHWLKGGKNRCAIHLADERYPPLLKEIPDPPVVLFAHGNLALLSKPALAVVGSRRATAVGRTLAYSYAQSLGRAGLVVVSGMAQGIDAAAHYGVLEAGLPTVAVMGTGMDKCFPARNASLMKQIIQRGLLLTEYAMGNNNKRWQFSARNRIISGLSLGALVVEAKFGSGSLITAGFALEQGREVFAVPGSVIGETHSGCHKLIRDGCTLVESTEHIFQELGGLTQLDYVDLPQPVVAEIQVTPQMQKVLEAMGTEPVSFDELLMSTKMPADALGGQLLELEASAVVVFERGLYQVVVLA